VGKYSILCCDTLTGASSREDQSEVKRSRKTDEGKTAHPIYVGAAPPGDTDVPATMQVCEDRFEVLNLQTAGFCNHYGTCI
jgi:hypothetical protein